MSSAPAALGERPIEAVLFDYGHTLIGYKRPDAALHRAYAEITRRLTMAGHTEVPSAERLLAEVHDRIEAVVSAHERAGRLEEIDLVAAERRAYEACGLSLSDTVLDEVTHTVQMAWWQGIVVSPSARDVLAALRRRGLRLGLCSNAPYRAQSLHGQLRHLGLHPLFDSVIFSSEVGWRKPSPQLFRTALASLDTSAARTVMVGDRRREDVSGARDLGLATIRTREYEDDDGPNDADAVIDNLGDLIPLLCDTSGDDQSVSAHIIVGPASRPDTQQEGR